MLVNGSIAGRREALVHVHRACAFGDIFKATLCDCGHRLASAVEAIEHERGGVLVYVRANKRHPTTLVTELQAYAGSKPDGPSCTRPLDAADLAAVVSALTQLEVLSVRLPSENACVADYLERHHIHVVSRPAGTGRRQAHASCVPAPAREDARRPVGTR